MILRMIAVGLKPEVQEANAHFRNRCKAEVDAWRLLQAGCCRSYLTAERQQKAACGRPSFLGQCRLPPQPDLYRNHQGSTAETPASAGQQDAYADNKRVARGSYTHLVQTRPYSRPECDK